MLADDIVLANLKTDRFPLIAKVLRITANQSERVNGGIGPDRCVLLDHNVGFKHHACSQ